MNSGRHRISLRERKVDMSENRKRLHIRLSEELDSDLRRIASRFKFRSACQLAVVLLRLFVDRVEHQDRLTYIPDDEVNEIDSMFSEFADWEPTPFNTHVPVTKRKRRK